VHWPAGIEAGGEVRDQYAHLIDMVPTVLELLELEPPAAIRGVTQSPVQGVSFAHALGDPEASTRRHTQYFEMLGHRSIYHDGWRAVCPWPGPSFKEAGKPFGEAISSSALTELDANGWELYHVAEDFAENHNLASEHPDKLVEMIGRWYVEAGKYDVMPVDGSGLARAIVEKPSAAMAARDRYVLFPNTQSVPFFAAPRVLNRPHSITARVEIPPEGAEGVLLCQGAATGGYALYVKDNTLQYVHNYLSREMFEVRADTPLTPGKHELRFEFEPTGEMDMANGRGAPGRFQLYIDGGLVANSEVPYTTPIAFNPGAMTCGANPGSTITRAYETPFAFTGKLESVVVDVSGELITDDEAEMRLHLVRQ
jgi:arylsulfatase